MMGSMRWLVTAVSIGFGCGPAASNSGADGASGTASGSNSTHGGTGGDGDGVPPGCGDGEVEDDEECDDGNTVANDGCDSDCKKTLIIDIAAGGAHNCALLRSGSVRCWGYNKTAALGYGHTDTIGDDEVPATAGDVDVGGRVVHVEGGGGHTCVVLEGGDVRCWGYNVDGLLGLGVGAPPAEDCTEGGVPGCALPDCCVGAFDTPAAAPSLDVGGSALRVALGSVHTCVLLDGGDIRCWGSSAMFPRLGYQRLDPVGDDEVPGSLPTVAVGAASTAISTGAFSSCALLESGSLRCWGGGILGHGNTELIGDDEDPEAVGDVPVGGRVGQVALHEGHTCAVLTDGSIRCWGANTYGQLGYGNTAHVGDDETPESVGPVPIVDPADDDPASAAQVVVGIRHTCVLLDDSSVRCWGYGDHGRLGHGSLGFDCPIDQGPGQDPTYSCEEDSKCCVGDDEPPYSTGFVDVGGPVTKLVAGGLHTCALLESGAVRCWGSAASGALGYGNMEDVGDTEAPSVAGDVEIF